MKTDPGRAWLDAARGGDEDAAAQLIREYHPRIFAFLRRLSGSESEATELTQKAFCRAWSSLASFAGRSSVSTWLHGIAYRTFADWRRSNHRVEVRPDAWWAGLPDLGPSPDVSAANADAAAVAFAAVDGLDPALRDTLHLHYYQGLTIEETAEVLEIATSTVKYRVREALTQLQRQLTHRAQPQPLSAHRRP